jgi:hypothetical protein
MSDGNRNPKGFRSVECSPPGAGLYPGLYPISCADQKERKGTEADANTVNRRLGTRRLKQQIPWQAVRPALRSDATNRVPAPTSRKADFPRLILILTGANFPEARFWDSRRSKRGTRIRVQVLAADKRQAHKKASCPRKSLNCFPPGDLAEELCLAPRGFTISNPLVANSPFDSVAVLPPLRSV